MLMTVLKGELAVKQSKALIRTFKQMKDYIVENQGLIGQREFNMQNIHLWAMGEKLRRLPKIMFLWYALTVVLNRSLKESCSGAAKGGCFLCEIIF